MQYEGEMSHLPFPFPFPGAGTARPSPVRTESEFETDTIPKRTALNNRKSGNVAVYSSSIKDARIESDIAVGSVASDAQISGRNWQRQIKITKFELATLVDVERWEHVSPTTRESRNVAIR